MAKNIPTTPLLIEAPTLPNGYAQIVRHILNHGGFKISPLVLTIANQDADHMVGSDTSIQKALDKLLIARGESDMDTVAFTIFPEEFHKTAADRVEFFSDYKDAYPRMKAMNARNRRGLYFERMTMWPGAPYDGNQLEWIIRQYKGRTGVRTSMFQASIFDPERDHTSTAQLGFPCLQHVAFVPIGDQLVLNAFYATQQLLIKAYGNYLGLIRLGNFMAAEMGLEFTRLNVNVGVAKLENIGKTTAAFQPIADACNAVLDLS